MTIPFVPHSPLIESAAYVGGPPFFKDVDVVFDVPMDTGSDPTLGSWDVLVDGAPIAIAAVAWQNPTTCRFTYAGFVDPVTSGYIRINSVDYTCISTVGGITAYPQSEQFFS